LKRAHLALLVVGALLVPLWALGDTVVMTDGRDTKGLLDVKKVKVEGQLKRPRWTFVTFKPWTKDRLFDRGYATVFIDTFDDARSDYYVLVRSTGLEIQAILMRDRKKKSDYEMGRLRAWKPSGTRVTVRVPLRRLKVPDSRAFYRWWTETLMTGEQCPRVCIDRVPDDGTVKMFLVDAPEPTPTPTITPTPSASPTPTGSPTPTASPTTTATP
jgi:hypothetical protein